MVHRVRGVLRTGYLDPVRVCLLVAVGCGSCWLVAVVAVVGVTPRILQVDILAKVLTSQELPNTSSSETKSRAMQRACFAHYVDARLVGIVI